MKEMLVYIFLMFLFPQVMMASTATQTDWSGGDGVLGPVIDFGTKFYIDTDIDCYNSPSSILLQKAIALIPNEHTVDGDLNGARSVYSTDVNGDGYMDVLGAAFYADDITWWENIDGSGTTWMEHTVDGSFDGPTSVYSADVNGDGYMDVLGAAYNTDDITWWENVDGSGTSWTEHTVDGDFNGARSVYSADFNGDGYMDVLGAAFDANNITWWENKGGSGTTWTEHTVDGSFDGASSVYSADINGDGYMDVLGAAYAANDITWWENIGGSGTSWTEHTVDGSFDGAHSVYSADVNEDGYMDLLGAANTADDITWWENVGGSGTSWTEHIVDGDFDGARSVCSADVNGDGYMDVLGAAFSAHDITWWENVDGSGTSWTEHTVDGSFDGATSVYSTDVNGDGYMDVLGAATYADDITWWDLTEFLPDGSLESSVLDVQESPSWQILYWTSTEPPGTSVAFQVRASDNSSNMGAWSDTLTAPSVLSGILAEEDNYFQYRAIMTTTDPLSTPTLQDITVGWQLFSSTEEESASWSLTPVANPMFSNCAVQVSVPQPGTVDLMLHDITGRVVAQYSQELPVGTHSLVFSSLAEGVYFCTMHAGDFTATERVVVLK